MSTQFDRQCQDILHSAVAHISIPGATLSIIDSSGVDHHFAAGLADKEANLKMQSQDRMLLGSIGKTYVAAAILQQVEKRRVGLSDKISDYLTKDWYQRVPNFSGITLAHLLRHTSGIPRWVFDPKVWVDLHKNPDIVWTIRDRLAFVFDKEPLHPVGEGFGYSDTNYILLGAILEKVTGQSFYDYVQVHFLDPLDLKDTSPSDGRSLRGMIPGYTVLDEQLMLPEKMVSEGRYAFNPQIEWCGGGFISTAPDLVKWTRLLYTGKVLSPEMTAAMTFPGEQPTNLGEGLRYGFGTMIWPDGRLGHTGFMPGYTAAMQYDENTGLSMGLLYNTDGPASAYRPDTILAQCIAAYRL